MLTEIGYFRHILTDIFLAVYYTHIHVCIQSCLTKITRAKFAFFNVAHMHNVVLFVNPILHVQVLLDHVVRDLHGFGDCNGTPLWHTENT